MAEANSTDLLMKFMRSPGSHIVGESTTDISTLGKNNPLLMDFKPGFMFEISRFTFKAGTSPNEATTPQANNQQQQGKNKASAASIAQSGGYKSWRSGKSTTYPVDLQPVSITRPIDISSPILMQDCIDCISYDSATLIKRKSAGTDSAGEVFLRVDFVGVLIIGIDWSNDDEVEEDCQFICRSVTISYRPQLPDGRLGATKSGFWSMVPGETQVVLK